MNREERRKAESLIAAASKAGAILVMQRKNFDDLDKIIEAWSLMLLNYEKKEKYGVETEEKAKAGVMDALGYLYKHGTTWPDFYISAVNPVSFSLDMKVWLVIEIPPNGVTSLAAHKFNKTW